MQQPTAEDIRKLALYDPVAAYGILLGIPRVPLVASQSVSFTDFTLDANGLTHTNPPLKSGLDTVLVCRTWFDNITFTLNVTGIGDAPPPFAGSVFQPQWLANLRKSTGIAIRAQVLAGPKYAINGNFTPLEDVVNVFASQWPAGLLLFTQQTIQTEFVLTALPGGSAAGLGAYNVTVTWNGWQFLDTRLDEMTGEQACCHLEELGFWTRNKCVGKR